MSNYKNEYTGDLFGVEDCPNCNGSGTVIEKFIFNEMFPMPMGESEEDCDICKGSGVPLVQQTLIFETIFRICVNFLIIEVGLLEPENNYFEKKTSFVLSTYTIQLPPRR